MLFSWKGPFLIGAGAAQKGLFTAQAAPVLYCTVYIDTHLLNLNKHSLLNLSI